MYIELLGPQQSLILPLAVRFHPKIKTPERRIQCYVQYSPARPVLTAIVLVRSKDGIPPA